MSWAKMFSGTYLAWLALCHCEVDASNGKRLKAGCRQVQGTRRMFGREFELAFDLVEF